MKVYKNSTWLALEEKAEDARRVTLKDLFRKDPERARSMTLEFGKLYYDFSKQRLGAQTLALLIRLAGEAGLDGAKKAMFSGEKINTTENRRVLHVALRQDKGPFPEEGDVMPEVLAVRERCFEFARGVRNGTIRGSTGKTFTDVVNIGIGGSDLGPKMMAHALRAYTKGAPRAHFVSNLDGAQMVTLLEKLDIERTLFVIVSKTFTTQETMMNAQASRDYIARKLGARQALGAHVAAVSSRPDLAKAFGVPEERVFPMWDWVGGRYSLWSAVGLSLMVTIGPEAFLRLLSGARAMDRHFISAPAEKNLPVMMALTGFWNSAFLHAGTLAVLPYNDSLEFFPAYLQQLEMESNGKSVGLDGARLREPACPVLWGGLGNNGQHAFFQLLHQGSRLVPCDFIAACRADYPVPGHQEALLANCFAQSASLAFGKSSDAVMASMLQKGLSKEEALRLLPHRSFPGNQPSSTILLEDISPESMGELAALYEHKVFVQGVLWGVNSFDQWGVELGKENAKKILPKLLGKSDEKFDASTEALAAYALKHL